MFGATFEPGGGGGGGFTLINKILLGSNSPSIDFSNIPQTHNILKIVAYLRSNVGATGEGVVIRFNGDAGNNYYTLRPSIAHNAVLTTAEQIATGAPVVGTVTGGLAPANSFGVMIADIPYYANTANHKVIRAYGFAHIGVAAIGNQIQRDGNGIWKSIAAINQITITPQTGPDWLAGAIAYLYGY